MLDAASEPEKFETYCTCCVSPQASNHLKTIELHQSDGLSGISFLTPNFETLTLQGCQLPEGRELKTIYERVAQSSIQDPAQPLWGGRPARFLTSSPGWRGGRLPGGDKKERPPAAGDQKRNDEN